MNGRVNGDVDSGNFIIIRLSVVDYFICNVDFFKFVKYFEVLDFNCLYFDIYMLLIC